MHTNIIKVTDGKLLNNLQLQKANWIHLNQWIIYFSSVTYITTYYCPIFCGCIVSHFLHALIGSKIESINYPFNQSVYLYDYNCGICHCNYNATKSPVIFFFDYQFLKSESPSYITSTFLCYSIKYKKMWYNGYKVYFWYYCYRELKGRRTLFHILIW